MKTLAVSPDALRTAVQLFHYGLGYEAPELDLALVSREFDFSKPPACPNDFRDAYWFVESFSKIPLNLEGLDREKSAYERFSEAEAACAVANARLCDAFNRPALPYDLLSRARSIVHSYSASSLGRTRSATVTSDRGQQHHCPGDERNLLISGKPAT